MRTFESSRRIADFLGLRRHMLALLAMVILVGLGEKMAERFLPLYLLALGGGAFSVGLLNGLDNLLSALYAFPGGYASDRLGYQRALILFTALAMLGYLIVILFPCWQAVIIGAIFFLSWSAISLPAVMDMVSRVLPPHKRTMGVSMHSLVRRIPMALGPVLGGMMIGAFGVRDGIRLAFAAALLLAAVALVMFHKMAGADTPAPRQGISGRGLSLIPPALRRLLVADILVRFCEQIPYAFVVVWCVKIHRITPLQFGILTTVEMATAMLIYIPVAWLADKGRKKPFVLATFAIFTLFPPALFFSRSFGWMIAAFVLRGLKEFGEPTRKALIMELAPEDKKASAFGIYYLVRDMIVSGAAFGGAFLWDASATAWLLHLLDAGQGLLQWIQSAASPALNFGVAFGFGVIGTLYFALFGKDLEAA